jgi:hypothetical protein
LRAAFFAWSAALGKILTVDNLRKRLIIIVDRCCLCKRDGEFVDHLFLPCDVAPATWNNILTCFGMSWVMPKSYQLVCMLVEVWKAEECYDLEDGAICILWCFWKEINLKSSMKDILASFFHKLYLWTVVFYLHCRLALLIFLFVVLYLVRCFLLYISSVLRSALCFQ